MIVMMLAVVSSSAATGTTHAAFPYPSRWIWYYGPERGCDAVVSGPAGKVWFCDHHNRSIGAISHEGVKTYFPGFPTHRPDTGLTVGPDGNIWYGADVGVVKMTTAGASTFYRLPDSEYIAAMIAGPDGDIWVAGTGGPNEYHLSKMSMSGHVTVYPPQPGETETRSLAVGSDGNVWYVDAGGVSGAIVGRVTPSGDFREWRIPGVALFSLTAAKDGSLYASEAYLGAGVLLRITPPGTFTSIDGPSWITDARYGTDHVIEGPDGNVWSDSECTAQVLTCLVRYDVQTKQFQYWIRPNGVGACIPWYAVAGPDKNIWIQGHTCGQYRLTEFVTGL